MVQVKYARIVFLTKKQIRRYKLKNKNYTKTVFFVVEHNNMQIGQKVKKLRLKLGMTQPKFAKFISEISGENITSITLCRIENYGKKGACNSIKPSLKIRESVHTTLLSIEKDEEKDEKKNNNQLKYSMSDREKMRLREIIDFHKDLGVFEQKDPDAIKIIDAIEGHIKSLEEAVFPDRISEKLDNQLKIHSIDKEIAEIDEELEKINNQINNLTEEISQENSDQENSDLIELLK